MNGYARFAVVAATVVVVAVGGLYLTGSSRQGGVGAPGASGTVAPSPSPALDAGTVTLTETGCTWERNPGTLPLPRVLSVELRNETDDYADFQLHWVKPGRTYAEGVEYVDELARRLTTGEDWPPNDVSILVHSQRVPAKSDATSEWDTTGTGEAPAPELQDGSDWRLQPGSYGIVCSANTSSTGEVLTTFVVGPLELMSGSPSDRASARPSS